MLLQLPHQHHVAFCRIQWCSQHLRALDSGRCQHAPSNAQSLTFLPASDCYAMIEQDFESLSMDASSADGGIVAEIRSRHGHSAQPESQQVLAVLQAVLEVIAAEGMTATPTTIFAALMSALERPDAQSSPAVSTAALCTLYSSSSWQGVSWLCNSAAVVCRLTSSVCHADCTGYVYAAGHRTEPRTKRRFALQVQRQCAAAGESSGAAEAAGESVRQKAIT
jgi:hypothetical protein